MMNRNVSVKHGMGWLTASADLCRRSAAKPITRLTRVAHKAPMRLLPVKKSSVRKAGVAVCALSNYGAGMLQGDSAELSIHVEAGAKLGLLTQGAARIYSQRVPSECKASLRATIEKDGVLVFAPDPCTMFASSSYSQTQEFTLHPDSSVALIDWFSSGRFKNRERWAFDKLDTRTQLKWLDGTMGDEDSCLMNDIPFLQDSTSIDLRLNNEMEHLGTNAIADFNCFASLILYGKHVQSIKERCQSLADQFAEKYTRIRQRDQNGPEILDVIGTGSSGRINNRMKRSESEKNLKLNLSGRVVMGVSKVPLPGKPSDAYVVRLASKTNEDIYRVFHDCLIPLAPCFGLEFYKERILAQRSEIRKKETLLGQVQKMSEANEREIIDNAPPKSMKADRRCNPSMNSKSLLTNSSFWSVVMLADSGLPTGSFAHSAGLEVAAQLGIVRGEEDVRNFIRAATRSSIHLLAPFLISGLRIVQNGNESCTSQRTTIKNRWKKLQRECHAVMVTNEPACSASIDQGKSMARVASQWIGQESSGGNIEDILECLKRKDISPHIAPTLGVVGGLLGLDEIQVCRLFAYCMARDLVSSAVRLSIVGPLASIPLLHNIQASAEDGIRAAYPVFENHPDNPLLAAATSAPVLEAIHPCHEMLEVRLFRT